MPKDPSDACRCDIPESPFLGQPCICADCEPKYGSICDEMAGPCLSCDGPMPEYCECEAD